MEVGESSIESRLSPKLGLDPISMSLVPSMRGYRVHAYSDGCVPFSFMVCIILYVATHDNSSTLYDPLPVVDALEHCDPPVC